MANGMHDWVASNRMPLLSLGAGLLGSAPTTGDRFQRGLLGYQQGTLLQQKMQDRQQREELAKKILDRNRQQVPGAAVYNPASPQGVPHMGAQPAQMDGQNIGSPSGLLGHMPTQGDPTTRGLLAAEAARSGDVGAAGTMLGMGSSSDLPASVREYQYVQGLSPEQREMYYKVKRGQSGLSFVDIPRSDGSTQKGIYDPSKGIVYDMSGNVLNAPVRPGEQDVPRGTQPEQPAQGAEVGRTPTIAERTESEKEAQISVEEKANWNQTADKYRMLETKWDSVTETVDNALQDTSWITTGPAGTVGSNIPGTPQYDYAQLLQTIKANIGFDELQRMRDASPTGGALGQVSEMENKLLQAVQGSLEVGQSPSQMKKNLKKIKKRLQDLRAAKRRAYLKDRRKYGDPGAPAIEGPDVGMGDDPLGLNE